VQQALLQHTHEPLALLYQKPQLLLLLHSKQSQMVQGSWQAVQARQWSHSCSHSHHTHQMQQGWQHAVQARLQTHTYSHHRHQQQLQQQQQQLPLR
jgi:hypothetical protein